MTRTTRALVPLGLFALVAGAAPLLAPYDPVQSFDLLSMRSQPPSWAHPFGTDPFARDVLSRVLVGARVSLFVSLSAVLLGLLAGVGVGAATVMAPRALRGALRRVLDVLLAVPRILLLLAIAAAIPSTSLLVLVALVGLTGWFATARQVADELEALQQREFALAAQAAGVPPWRLLRRHLLPHLGPLLVVNGTFAVANTIGLETGLSFLGLGVQPPNPSWGTILHEGAGTIGSDWWLVVFPAVATVLAVLACNRAGDVLRDRFAPAHVAGP